MNPKREEPDLLKRGKQYHKIVQKEWEETAEGHVQVETPISKPSGRRGRIDIQVDADRDLVAVVEIKASDWDRMSPVAVRRNVRRQCAQIWDYIESQLAEGKEVAPGIIFPRQPSAIERRDLIEDLFDEQGIPVVWENERTEERSIR